MNSALSTQIEGGIKEMIDTRKRWLREARAARNILNWLPYLPELPETMQFKSVGEYLIELRHPYNKLIRQQVHDYLLSLGWEVDYERREADCKDAWDDPYITYINMAMPITPESFLKLKIIYDDIVQGSTCKRQIIGERKIEKVEKIFEWVCEDALQEEANE